MTYTPASSLIPHSASASFETFVQSPIPAGPTYTSDNFDSSLVAYSLHIALAKLVHSIFIRFIPTHLSSLSTCINV